MNIARFLLFILIAFTIYFGMHYYVYHNLAVLTSNWKWFKWVFIGLALSFPAVEIIGHASPLCPGPWTMRLASLWLGIVFLLFFWLLAINLLHFLISIIPGSPFIPKSYRIMAVMAWVLITCVWGLISGLSQPETVTYQVDRSERFKSGKLLRIVQLSDLHLGTSLGADFLAQVISRVHDLNPDLILITGDLIDMDIRNLQNFIPLLKKLRAPSGTFAVTGNHEYISNVQKFLDIMSQAGIPVLQNQLVFSNDGVQIAGVNDLEGRRISGSAVRSDMNLCLKDYNPGFPCILMSHQPKKYEAAVSKGVDVILSGHTHSGQLFPFHLFVKMAFKHISGNHKISQNTNIIISNGTGFWGPPLRVLAPAQIVVVEFRY
ncbi:metallophosphoesterase [Fibrobacterota bacterium]